MPTARAALFTVSFVALTLISGCGLRGSGTPATELREVDGFEKIELGGAFELVVHVQPGVAQKLEVTADDNILPELRTSVSGRELDVEFDKGGFIRPKTPIEIEVWVPTLSAVDVSGAADIEVEGLHGERFELDLSGAADSILRGEVERLEVDISGAGELEAKDLHAKTVELELSGAGEAVVWASESLDVDISGAGEVTYYGSPGNISEDISGAGELKRGG